MHGYNVGVGMRSIASRKKESDTIHAVKFLLGASNPLPRANDLACKIDWQIVEIIEVTARDDLNMTATDRRGIEERNQFGTFKNGSARNPIRAQYHKRGTKKSFRS